MFAKNVGSVDRIVRIVAGLLILSLFFVYPDASWRYWTLLGIVPLLTGLFSTCALYSLIGVNTNSKK